MRITPPVEVPGAVWKTPKREAKNYQDFKKEDGTFDCSGTARTQSAMRAIHDVTGPRRTAECWRKDDYSSANAPYNGLLSFEISDHTEGDNNDASQRV